MITEIKLVVQAPGLSTATAYDLFNSIGGKSTKKGELNVYVPPEANPGVYTIKLTWSFYMGFKKYQKSNKIKINVIE